MTYVCSNCLFCEAVEDEDYCSCQLRQALVMPYDRVCDFFELNRKSFKEVNKVTMELNGVNEYTNDLQDEYTNTTELPKVKIVEQKGDDIALITRLFGTYGEEYTPEEKRRVAESRARQINEHYEEDVIEYASMEGLREAIETMETAYEDDTSPRKPDFFGYTTTTPCSCDYCTCKANPVKEDAVDMMWAEYVFNVEDVKEATNDLLDELASLGEKEATPRDVLKAILSLEASLALLRRLLLEFEELEE